MFQRDHHKNNTRMILKKRKEQFIKSVKLKRGDKISLLNAFQTAPKELDGFSQFIVQIVCFGVIHFQANRDNPVSRVCNNRVNFFGIC